MCTNWVETYSLVHIADGNIFGSHTHTDGITFYFIQMDCILISNVCRRIKTKLQFLCKFFVFFKFSFGLFYDSKVLLYST